MMIKSVGAGFSNIYSHFASSGLSATSQAASGVVDGNYSYANMQTDNVSGNSWNTNSTTAFGQMTRQLSNGGMGTQTRDGSMVWDTSGAMSKLPVDINVGRQIASAQQQMARESEVQAESALHGYNQSVTSAWNTLKQFGTNMGTSSSMTTGADSTESSQDTMARSKMMNAVDSYAKTNHISRDEAFSQLMDKSVKGAVSGEIYGSARAGAGFELFGTGGHVEGGGKVSVSGTASSGSQDNTSESGRHSNTNNHDSSSQAVKDFREASDYLTSHKTTTSGNVTDNNASSRVDQFAASLSSAKNSYDQYTTSKTRSHEYSDMASRTESMSGQMSENLTQQFANFVQKQAPQNAEAILTDTSSPEIAAQREALARDFVKSQVEPKIDGAYQEARGSLGNDMGGVSAGGGRDGVVSDYGQHASSIDNMTAQAGIKHDVGNGVEALVSENRQINQDARQKITTQGQEVQKQHTDLQNNHNLEGNKIDNEYNRRTYEQKALPGADTRDELLRKAQDYEKNHKK